MNIIKIVLIILFIGFLLQIYVKYSPIWVEKFQEVVLNQPVKKEQSENKEKEEEQKKQQIPKKDGDENYEEKSEEEIRKILGIKDQKEEPKEESIVDKIKNYIKMLKSKLFEE